MNRSSFSTQDAAAHEKAPAASVLRMNGQGLTGRRIARSRKPVCTDTHVLVASGRPVGRTLTDRGLLPLDTIMVPCASEGPGSRSTRHPSVACPRRHYLDTGRVARHCSNYPQLTSSSSGQIGRRMRWYFRFFRFDVVQPGGSVRMICAAIGSKPARKWFCDFSPTIL